MKDEDGKDCYAVSTLSSDDRWQIHDLLCLYCLAVDRKEFELLREVFRNDGVADYGELGIHRGVDGIISAVKQALGPLDATHHLLGTSTVSKVGGHVEASTYFVAQHINCGKQQSQPDDDKYVIAGTYMDTLVATDEGWRIVNRLLRISWSAGNVDVLSHLA